MNNLRQRLPRKETYTRRKVPIIAALVGLTILVPAVGFIWFGWWDIPQNRKVLDSLPLPPGAELIDIDSEPNYRINTLIYPHSWSTLAKYQIPSHTPEYLTEFYISELRSKWNYCRTPWVPGARFIARGYVVSIDASGAADNTRSTRSFDILVEYSRRGNPCPHLMR